MPCPNSEQVNIKEVEDDVKSKSDIPKEKRS